MGKICKKCGKEVEEDSEFCNYCGKKMTCDEMFKKRLVTILIVLVIMISIIMIAILLMLNKKKTVDDNSGNISVETYERNRLGLFKSDKILEEKYNENGDLIYCRFKQGEETKENNYYYTYDINGRATKIVLNSNESTFLIEYNMYNKISKITTSYELGQMEYRFRYVDDLIIVKKYNTISMENYSLENEYDGVIIIGEKQINGKNYVLIEETDKYENLKKEVIYEKSSEFETNSFQKFGFIPLEYLNLPVIAKAINLIIPYSGFTTYMPVFNPERCINQLNESDYTSYDYDKEGRILLSSSKYNTFYFKYEAIDDKSYYCYCLIDGGAGDGYKALGMNSQYEKEKYKFYLDDNNKVYKYEGLEHSNVTDEDFIKLKDEFFNYINENKVDDSQILSEFSEIYLDNLRESKLLERYISDDYEDSDDNSKELTDTRDAYNHETIDDSTNKQNKNVIEDTTFEITDIVLTSESKVSKSKYNMMFNVKLNIGKDMALNESNSGFYEILNNGRKKYISAALTGEGSDSYIPCNDIIDLEVGVNNIDVFVSNDAGVSFSKTLTVTYEPPAPEIKNTYFSYNPATGKLQDLTVTVVNPVTFSTDTEGITVTVNGKSAENVGACFRYNITEGEDTFKIVVRNQYGNTTEKTVPLE